MACRNRLMMLLGFCLAILFLVGCNAIIEGTHTNRWPHEPEPTPAPPGEYITVSAVAELELGIWNLVSNQLENGLFRIVYPDPEGAGVILTDAIMDVQLRPLVAYAVGGGGITPVILAERPDLLVEIRVHYQKEPEQIAEVRTVHVPSTAITFLEEMLRYDALYLAMLVPARVADVNFVSMVYDFYYSHPLVVIRRPAVDVNLYPSGGGGVQRIVEIELDFGFSPEELSVMRADLLEAATDLLEEIPADFSPAQQIAWLAEHLGAWYDPTLEEVDLLHDTAYGALTRQTASSEGFAMAFAALLSLLELDVYVVLGALDGVDHVWNIFYLDGYYYHVDVSRLFYFGAEYTLFVSDIEMVQNGYSWDLSRYPQAYGPLPYPLVTS